MYTDLTVDLRGALTGSPPAIFALRAGNCGRGANNLIILLQFGSRY